MLSTRPAEITFVEKATGLHVPTLKELSEIESSSRLRAENSALLLEHSNSVRRRNPRRLCDTVFGGQLFDVFPIRDFLHFALPMSSFSQPAALFEEPIEPFDSETRRLFQPFAAVYFVMRNR